MTNPLRRLISSIQEQTWFIKLRAKWDELDAQSRLYIQGAATVLGVILLSWVTIGSWWKVRSIRKEISQREEIISSLQAGADELRMLRQSIPSVRNLEEDSSPWVGYIESVASSIGIDKANLEISSETQGQAKEFSKESLFEIDLKKINVKQLTRFSFQIENGKRAIKIKKMSIETLSDMSGYLNVKLSISAYSVKKPT